MARLYNTWREAVLKPSNEDQVSNSAGSNRGRRALYSLSGIIDVYGITTGIAQYGQNYISGIKNVSKNGGDATDWYLALNPLTQASVATGNNIKNAANGNTFAQGELIADLFTFFIPSKELSFISKIEDIEFASTIVRSSAMQLIERRFVPSMGDLSKLENKFREGLATIEEDIVKPESGDRWVTGINKKGERVRMEYSNGHASTGEAAHVQFEKFNNASGKKGRFQTTGKYFYDPKAFNTIKKTTGK